MVKFNSIADQLKSPTCKKVIGILNAVKSKTILRTWKELDDRVTDAASESKVGTKSIDILECNQVIIMHGVFFQDNVKYLYTLEKFCEPLYRADPSGMIPGLSGLVNAIKMIYR
jgi:dynein heavy chain